MTYFNEYFTCPHCAKPKYTLDGMKQALIDGVMYCTSCGGQIDNHIIAALEEKKGLAPQSE